MEDLSSWKEKFEISRKYHSSQMRQSGDPYYSHPIEVAIMLAEFVAEGAPRLFTAIMLQAALLHDTIEDTELTEEVITEIFGLEVAKHVEGLTRIKPYGKISAEESLNLLVKQKQYDTVLIKFFDRIHNLQTLGAKSPEKVKKVIEESLISFVKIAMYIEAHEIKQQLIKLCYKNLGMDFNKPQIAFQDNFQLLFPIF